MFKQLNRAYSDNDISEFAGKFLPAHPTARYQTFNKLWKQTRKMGGYIPRPSPCQANEEDYFPCCLKCAAATPDRIQEILAHRVATKEWLTAHWVWDFGFTLPPELVSLWGIGTNIPELPIERDRVFVFGEPISTRKYLRETLQEHAQIAGDDLHETKIAVTASDRVTFPGQMIASPWGDIFVAQPRTALIGQGKEVFEQFFFQKIEMPYVLPILRHDSEVLVDENDIVRINGIRVS